MPYRNTVQAANDLAEGRIQLMMSAFAIVRPLVEAGKLKMLAFTARQRAAAAPDVPTAAEAGTDLTIEGLVGVFGPRNLPREAAERIGADVRELLGDPAIAARLVATGQVVNFGTAAEFAARSRRNARRRRRPASCSASSRRSEGLVSRASAARAASARAERDRDPA